MADEKYRMEHTPEDLDAALDLVDELALEISNKVDKVPGKGLSTEDYTTNEKEKLSGLTQYTDAMAKSTVYGLGTSIASNADLDSYTTPGVYNCTPSVATTLAHCPTNQSLRLEVKNFASASSYEQTIITPENTTTGEVLIYRRLMLSGTWKPWVKYVSSEVIDDSVGAVANTGAKNLLKTTITSGSKNSITYTVNSDGTITLDIPSSHGTSTTEITVRANAAPPSTMVGKSLVLSGCPSGGSSTTFRMILQNTTSGYSTLATDEGNGSSAFTVSSNITQMRLMLMVYKDCPAMTVTIKPMIRDANIKDDTYEPYAPTNRELYEMILAL